jgi:oxalate decarboxylase/phosphoglucose isomerase-like protein (cupin superfamily)
MPQRFNRIHVGGAEGGVYAEDDADEREVTPGNLVHIPPDIYHSTVNTGDGPLKLIAIYSLPGPEAELRAMGGVTIEPPLR